jgi:hypothetical protein
MPGVHAVLMMPGVQVVLLVGMLQCLLCVKLQSAYQKLTRLNPVQ